MTEFVGGNRSDRNTKQDTIPDFQKIANDIQSAMQAAIAEVEKLAAEAGADREQAADIRSQDTALRHEIMNRENRQVEDFYAKNAKEIKAEMREQLLEIVAQKLLNTGKTEEQIAMKLTDFSQ